MSYIVNGKSVKNVGLITEPSSYGLTATPENMQAGTTAVVGGEIVEGTGKAFEFAVYGQGEVYSIPDSNGDTRYGMVIPVNGEYNIVFISTKSDGDVISQDSTLFKDAKNRVVKIGVNRTTSCDVYASYEQGLLSIYAPTWNNTKTSINYFIGKDRYV